MARRGGKRRGGRGVAHTTSILTVLFAVAPAAYLLTNIPSGMQASVIGYLLGATGGNWTFLQNAGWALAMTIAQNWVTVLIMLAVAFVAITVVRKLGRGARITKHLKA